MTTFLTNLASIATILALIIALIVYRSHIAEFFSLYGRKTGGTDRGNRDNPGKRVEPQNGVWEFDRNKQQYRDWLAQHPHGFVINTPRNKPANNMILHKATCGHINRPDSLDGAYIKITSEQVDSLPTWMKQNGNADGQFSGVCGQCRPIPSNSPLVRQKEAKP